MERLVFVFLCFLFFSFRVHATLEAPSEQDKEHLDSISSTLRGPNKFEIEESSSIQNPHKLNGSSNYYQVSTYSMFARSKDNPDDKNTSYLWVSQDYLLSAAPLAENCGIRVKSYTISTRLVDEHHNPIEGVSILESSPHSTDPTRTVTSSITLPMNLNATFPSGGGVTMGMMPGWQRSFAAPSTRIKKKCEPPMVKWVYEIHRKSPIASSDFDPSHKWVWKIVGLNPKTKIYLECTLDVNYKMRKRSKFKEFFGNWDIDYAIFLKHVKNNGQLTSYVGISQKPTRKSKRDDTLTHINDTLIGIKKTLANRKRDDGRSQTSSSSSSHTLPKEPKKKSSRKRDIKGKGKDSSEEHNSEETEVVVMSDKS